jgi:hypothetical protein
VYPRVPLALTVHFAAGEDEQELQGVGTTKNVSAGGAYFLTSEWQSLGVGQDLGLELSGLSIYNHGPLFRELRGRATVLRVDPPDDSRPPYRNAGVAVRFDERPRLGVYRFSA